jgi:hypothetical protein
MNILSFVLPVTTLVKLVQIFSGFGNNPAHPIHVLSRQQL